MLTGGRFSVKHARQMRGHVDTAGVEVDISGSLQHDVAALFPAQPLQKGEVVLLFLVAPLIRNILGKVEVQFHVRLRGDLCGDGLERGRLPSARFLGAHGAAARRFLFAADWGERALIVTVLSGPCAVISSMKNWPQYSSAVSPSSVQSATCSVALSVAPLSGNQPLRHRAIGSASVI